MRKDVKGTSLEACKGSVERISGPSAGEGMIYGRSSKLVWPPCWVPIREPPQM